MFSVTLVTQPQIDLSRFAKLVKSVNEIDALRLPSHQKFGRAVEELFDEDQLEQPGERHLCYGFHFELPFNLMLEVQNFKFYSYFRLTLIQQGMIVKGIITGPLDLWRQFCEWGKEHHLISPFTDALEKQLPCR
jgi:hypothetical protein